MSRTKCASPRMIRQLLVRRNRPYRLNLAPFASGPVRFSLHAPAGTVRPRKERVGLGRVRDAEIGGVPVQPGARAVGRGTQHGCLHDGARVAEVAGGRASRLATFLRYVLTKVYKPAIRHYTILGVGKEKERTVVGEED